ncbi:MAG: hypothetical protein AB7G28_19620 [Pirellulales bacterium]
MGRTFVGIGFGPIQSGLFLLEAHASKNFERLVVAEVVPETVAAVQNSGGRFRVNVAKSDGIESHEVTGVEIYNPLDCAGADELIEAIATADEIATALPSVDFYRRGKPSPAELLARGMERKFSKPALPQTVVYAAENHNHAAEILRNAVTQTMESTRQPTLDNRVEFVNTVIGKMSGVVTDPRQIVDDGLVPLVADGTQAVLVEEFNRILISHVQLPGFQRGIEVFQEKAELLPFEEAKLFGHNAAHALLGYLAHRAGLTFVHESRSTSLLEFVEAAFLVESGGALRHRYGGIDPLFSAEGWAAYVHDLLKRMVNPYLKDRVDRIIRDPRRKLGWDDRLTGTMRRAIESKIAPRRFAAGAAAAAQLMLVDHSQQSLATLLNDIWQVSAADPVEREAVLEFIRGAADQAHGLSGTR